MTKLKSVDEFEQRIENRKHREYTKCYFNRINGELKRIESFRLCLKNMFHITNVMQIKDGVKNGLIPIIR